MADLFISYARRDAEFVRELVERLNAHGTEVWVDWEDILPTTQWFEEIRRGIERSDAFVFVITPDSVHSSVCRDEIVLAEELNKRIVPILRRGVDGLQLPESIASVDWLSLPESGDLDEGVARLEQVLKLNIEEVQKHTRWGVKAGEWDRSGRDASLLLRGKELQDAEEWLTTMTVSEREPAPTPLHLEYVLASRRAATRRQRLVLSAFAVGIAIALALAALALVQRDRAVAARKDAVSRLLASEALDQMNGRVDLGVLLAIAAHKVKATPEARDALFTAVRRTDHVAAFLDGDIGAVTVARLSPDGRTLAAGGENGKVALWHVGERRPYLRLAAGKGQVDALAFLPDRKHLATLIDGEVTIRTVRAGRAVQHLSEPGAQAIAFTPTGSLVVGNEEGVAIGDPDGRTAVFSMGDRAPVHRLALSPDGRTLAAGGPYGATLLLPGRGRAQPVPLGDENVRDLAFDHDGTTVAVVSGGGRVTLWAVARRPRATVLKSRVPVTSVAFDPQEGSIATGGKDGSVTVWARDGLRPVKVFRGHGAEVSSLAFGSREGTIASGSFDGSVVLWQVLRPASSRSVDLGCREGARPEAACLEALDHLVPLGDRGMAAAGAGRVVVVDGPGDRARRLTAVPGGATTLVAASADGQLLAASGPQTLALWRDFGRRLLRTGLRHDGDRPLSLAVSRDGSEVAQGTQRGTIDVWGVGGDLRAPIRLDGEILVQAIAFSPSGASIAAGGGDGSVGLIELESRAQRMLVRPGGAAVTAVAFSADGRLLAIGRSDGTVAVKNLDGRGGSVLAYGKSGVSALSFERSGDVLALGDDAGVVLSDINWRRRIGPRLALGGPVVAFTFRASGSTAVAGTSGGTVFFLDEMLWNDGVAVSSLCERVGRPLTERERDAHLSGVRAVKICQ
jgi:WD40 repeat protein